MRRSLPADQAGFALSLLLLALAWPGRELPPEVCDHPVVLAPGEVACAADARGVPRLAGPLRRLFDQPIDPNRADPATLETLPGIGPARAAAIVRERCKRAFASISELKRVPGLGPQRVRALEPYVAIGDRLAPEGRASVNSGSCRSSCENGGDSVRIGPGCRRSQSTEAGK
jgi:hypothetical protein